MQAIGLFFAVFFGNLLACVLLFGAKRWLFRCKHPSKVKILILPGQEETLEYTLRNLRQLQKSGRLDIVGIQHKASIVRKKGLQS